MPAARRSKAAPKKKRNHLKLVKNEPSKKAKAPAAKRQQMQMKEQRPERKAHPFSQFMNRHGETRHRAPVPQFYVEPPRKKAV